MSARRPFVAREADRRLLHDALVAPAGLEVLRVTGPTGIGKTALLMEAQEICARRSLPCAMLTQSEAPITRECLVEVAHRLGDEQRASGASRRVLLLDDLHLHGDLERWLTSRFLPDQDALTVVAADRRSFSPWWADASSVTCRTLHLDPLPPEAVRAFLAERRVPAAQVEAIVDFADGNPLLMTLSADAVLAGAGVVPVEGLLRLRPSICRGATDPDQCQRCTTLMLARASPLEMLNHLATAEGTFEHLRASTVDETPLGLRPHEVTRQVAMTHLRTHCPSALARAAVSVRQSLAARSNLTVREREVLDLLLLGRSVADMATALQISPRTVKFHQQNVLAKVGADSRLDLIRLLM